MKPRYTVTLYGRPVPPAKARTIRLMNEAREGVEKLPDGTTVQTWTLTGRQRIQFGTGPLSPWKDRPYPWVITREEAA